MSCRKASRTGSESRIVGGHASQGRAGPHDRALHRRAEPEAGIARERRHPSMPKHVGWQVPEPRDQTYRVVIANGPPDTETIDRRRVDPPAGCRAVAEPAYLTVRRSVVDPSS